MASVIQSRSRVNTWPGEIANVRSRSTGSNSRAGANCKVWTSGWPMRFQYLQCRLQVAIEDVQTGQEIVAIVVGRGQPQGFVQIFFGRDVVLVAVCDAGQLERKSRIIGVNLPGMQEDSFRFIKPAEASQRQTLVEIQIR